MESRKNDDIKIILPTSITEAYFGNCLEILKTLDICKYNPPSWLKHTETPYKWAQVINPKKIYNYDISHKLEDYPEEDPDGCYSYEKYCLLLINVFQIAFINDREKIKQALEKLKNFVEEISTNEADCIYKRIGEAFKHVLLAVTAQVSLSIGDITEEDSRNIGLSLVSYSEMEPEIKAGIEAIKARFYLTCSKDCMLAIKHIKEATNLDPEFAPWLYWTGKVTRNIRRYNKQKELDEEILYFESALEKKLDPKYILFLAQGYREKAKYLQYKHKSCRSKISEEKWFLERSLELYKECWNLKKDSAAINRRLGNGVMSLKKPYADYTLAEESLLQALKLSKNPCTFHIIGSFYFKHKQDYQNAVEYFTKGAKNGLIQCFHELILMKYVVYHNYDPYEDLKIMEDVMKYTNDIPSVYSDLGWYYLSVKYDLCKAVEYFFKTLEREDDEYLKKFWSYIFFIHNNIDIYSILINEVMRFQEENTEKLLDNLNIKKLFDKISENPGLVCQDNGKDLTSVKCESQHKLWNWKNKYSCNKNNIHINPSENKYGRKNGTERIVNYSKGCNNNKQINWRNEPKEIKSVQNTNNKCFQEKKTLPEKNKILSWRVECKNN